MSKFSQNNKKLIAPAVLVILMAAVLEGWWLTAAARGTLLARFDVWRGHYAIHSYGLNVSGREFAKLLKERYGIGTQVDALCIVSVSERQFADSYNKVSTAAANRRFGHDVFKECNEEARREWEAKRVKFYGPSDFLLGMT